TGRSAQHERRAAACLEEPPAAEPHLARLARRGRHLEPRRQAARPEPHPLALRTVGSGGDEPVAPAPPLPPPGAAARGLEQGGRPPQRGLRRLWTRAHQLLSAGLQPVATVLAERQALAVLEVEPGATRQLEGETPTHRTRLVRDRIVDRGRDRGLG